jgi:hypothetical protein
VKWGLAGFIAVLMGAALAAACTQASSVDPQRMAALQQRLGALEIEATRAEDIRAIKKLQRVYGYYLEKGLGDDLADLFSSTAEAEYAAGIYVGDENIRAWFKQLSAGNQTPGRLGDHMNLQPVVDLASDGQTAKGRWRVLLMAGAYGQSASWGEGLYEIGYIKEAGVWKIDRLHWYQNFVAPYDGGWVKKRDAPPRGRSARPGAVVPAKPRSDPNQKSWPEAYVPPFHYADRNAKAGGETAAAPASEAAAPDLEMLAEELAKVEVRIQRAADEQAVENLQAAFGYYFDKKLWDEVIALFAEDGTFETGQSGVYRGKTSIRGYLDAMGTSLQPDELFHHIQLEPVVTISDDGLSANIRAHMIGEIGKFNQSALWRGGIYENAFVKEGDVWKIKSIRLFDTFASPYDSGWGKAALPSVDLTNGKAPPPDAPPSASYKLYPDYFVPPFHFANPVTGKPARLTPVEAAP